MSLVMDTHREFLSDANRILAYRRAIEETVRPGHCVVDLGSGTGILGLLACRAGAARVYSIESEGIIGVARKFACDNGYGDRIRFLRGLSTRIELPERADVVISDQIGRFGFEAGIVQYFHDARQRFLKPGGVLLPGSVQLWASPISCSERRQHMSFWDTSPCGFDLHAAHSIAHNTGYPVELTAEQLLASPASLATIDFHASDNAMFVGSASFEIERAGQMDGIAGWFQAQLSPSVTMTNAPLAADRIKRRNVFLPIETTVPMNPGDIVRAKIRVIPSELAVSWTISIEARGASGPATTRRFTHSTMLGMLLSQEDLDKTEPASKPKLTPWGEARRSILELIDGQRELGEIEQEMLRRHPDLFPTLKQAAAYVAEVVTRYTV